MNGNVAGAPSTEAAEIPSAPVGEVTAPRRGTVLSRRARKWLGRYWPTLAVLTVFAFLVLLPVGILLYAAFLEHPPRPGAVVGGLTLENFRQVLVPERLSALTNSVTIAVGGTLLALTVGSLLAWLAARTDVPFKWLVKLAGITPLFVSTLVGAQAWSYLGSPNQGYLNIILGDLGIPLTINTTSLGGIIFVLGIYYVPYPYIFLYSSLTLANPDLEAAARSHGASVPKVMRHVTLPLSTPALLGSSILIFVLIIENFPVPAILGAGSGTNTLPGLIYSLMVSSPTRSNEAAVVTIMLTGVMVIFIMVQQRILNARQFTSVSGKGLRPKQISLGRWRWPAAAVGCIYFLLAVALPFFALAQMAFRSSSFVPDMAALFDLTSLTLTHFVDTITAEQFWTSLENSLITGIGCAVIGVVIAFVASNIVYRTRTRGRALIEYVAMAPASIPALALGLGMLWTWSVVPTPIKIYGTIAILVFACVSSNMPQGFRGVSSSMLQVGAELEESALVSGAKRRTAIVRILLPLLRSGMIGTMFLLLITAMRELSALIFLYTSQTQTLALAIWGNINAGESKAAASTGLLYCALLLLATVIAQSWESRTSVTRI